MSKTEIIHKIESYIPNFILKAYRKCKRFYFWELQQIAYKFALHRVQKKQGPVNVIFINAQPSIWKYDSLFNQMLNNEHFNPMVLVCPLEGRGKALMLSSLNESYNFFKKKGYPVRCAYNTTDGSYLNIKELSPDILFYPTQYPHQLNKRYNQYTLRRYLKCLVNYAFVNVSGDWSCASAVHGLMWRYFAECESNRQLALSYNKRDFRNIRVVGYPIYDEFQNATGEATAWKNPHPKFKRIIWAPHHTIEGQNGLLQFSTFLLYQDIMLHLAEKYKDKVQFVFKPHPLLRNNLYGHAAWGKERTDAYYERWEKGENTAFVNGTYMDLFKSSDAMIHDCGSFIVEYLYTQKPVLYLGTNREEQSNIVGKKAYQCHYHGNSIEDIENFITSVVIEGNDPMKNDRREFFNANLLPPHGKSVAENIIDELKKELCK